MENRKLRTYNVALSLKINFITALLLVLSFSCATLFIKKFEREALISLEGVDNGAGAFVAIIVASGIVGIVLISYSVLVPWFIPLFHHFRDNLKSFIGITITNFSITVFLLLQFTPQLAICYFIAVVVGMYCSMSLRYNILKN